MTCARVDEVEGSTDVALCAKTDCFCLRVGEAATEILSSLAFSTVCKSLIPFGPTSGLIVKGFLKAAAVTGFGCL